MQKLLRTLKSFHATRSRAHLPWRKTADPYKILVSELMLQQTQVERVIPKYEAFIEAFPTFETLARAPFSHVLKSWSGLGYNRRAKYLHETAKILVKKHNGTLPKDPQAIEKLPGIGHYTARAIAAFAWNKREIFVETNIRTVFIHFCFTRRRKIDALIPDAEILPLVRKALEESHMNPRDFYAALMDYGSYLKRRGIRLNSRSKHYAKQSKFKGSERELRGAIVRILLLKPATVDELAKATNRKKSDVAHIISRLCDEGFIIIKNHKFVVAA